MEKESKNDSSLDASPLRVNKTYQLVQNTHKVSTPTKIPFINSNFQGSIMTNSSTNQHQFGTTSSNLISLGSNQNIQIGEGNSQVSQNGNQLQQQQQPQQQNQQNQLPKKSIDMTEQEAFSMLEKEEGNIKNDVNNNEEDKKVLIIYAGGFLGGVCHECDGESRVYVEKNALQNRLKQIEYFCDLDFTYQHGTDGFLVTPLTEFKKRIYYKVQEMERLVLYSTDFDRNCLLELISILRSNYQQYDSFVVIHPTDSLTYSSSFISFMIQNLSKSIIFTGSMVPLSIMRNDAFNNLLGSIYIAGHFNIPEVTIFFHNQLLRANRSTKIDAQGLNCFTSSNFPLLAEFKVLIEVKWNLILRNDDLQPVNFLEQIGDSKIETIRYTPCFQISTLLHLINSGDIKGIIIESYGPGNLPTNDENFQKVCQVAKEKQVFIISISQSLRSYTSESNIKSFNALGILYGGDMTVEATLAKLSYLLSQGYNDEQVAQMMGQNLRGELTLQQNEQKFEIRQENLVEAITEKFSSRQQQVDLIKSYIMPNVACYMAQYGFMHYLEEMKVQQTNFKFCDYDKRTALHMAVREQKELAVQFLINEQVDLNLVDYFGNSPLYEAILTNNKKIVYLLVQNGAQLNADQHSLTNLLLEAGQKGDIDRLKLLFHAGLKNLNDYSNVDDRNIAHIAAAEGQFEIVKFLKYTARFDFSQRDVWDRTPLDDATEFNHSKIVNLLQSIQFQ